MVPLDALSLASAVIQIVDVATKVIAETRKLIKSGADALPQVEAISAAAKRSTDLADDVEKLTLSAQPQHRNEAKLGELVAACRKDTQDLASYLEKFKVAGKLDGRKSRMMRALFKVVKINVRHDKIEEKHRRLQASRSELSDQLLFCIYDDQVKGFEELRDLVHCRGSDSTEVLLTVKDQLLTRIELSQKETKASLTVLEKLLVSEQDRKNAHVVINTLRCCDTDTRRSDIQGFHQGTFNWIFTTAGSSLKSWLLDGNGTYWISGHAGAGKSTLMKHLRTAPETHTILTQWAKPQTLIVLEHYFSFRGGSFDRSGEGMLRSLLYQALSNRPDHPKLIEVACPVRWSAAAEGGQQNPWTKRELVDALRSIGTLGLVKFCVFVDRLDECEVTTPDELLNDISQICEGQHIKVCVSSRPWAMFEKLSGNASNMLRLEDHSRSDILRIVCDKLSKASSELFPERMCKALQITDTQDDKYASSQQILRRLSRAEREARTLIHDIVDKAGGIILWASLVVDKLVEHLDSGPSLKHLKSMIDQCPARLEDYFRRSIYERISSAYRHDDWSETAIVLVVASALHNLRDQLSFRWMPWSHGAVSHSLFLYWVVRQIIERNGRFNLSEAYNYTLDTLYCDNSLDDERTATYTGRYLRGCTRDVLRVNFESRDTHLLASVRSPFARVPNQVGFWHRTAFDILTSAAMQDDLLKLTRPDFRTPDFISRLLVLGLKAGLANTVPGKFDREIACLIEFIIDLNVAPAVACVDQLMVHDFRFHGSTRHNFKSTSELGKLLVHRGFQRFVRAALDCIPEWVAGYCLFPYGSYIDRSACVHLIVHACGIQARVVPEPPNTSSLQGPINMTSFQSARVDMDLVELLLSKGCSPNMPMCDEDWPLGKTLWHQLLKTWYLQSSGLAEVFCMDGKNFRHTTATNQCETSPSMVLPLVMLLIRYGAGIQRPVCVAPGSCKAVPRIHLKAHTDHEFHDVARILFASLPPDEHVSVATMLELYASAERKEQLIHERCERIKDYDAHFLISDEDRELMRLPTRFEVEECYTPDVSPTSSFMREHWERRQ